MIGQVLTQKLGLPMMIPGFASQKATPAIPDSLTHAGDNAEHDATLSEQVSLSQKARQLNAQTNEDEPDWQQVQEMAGQLSFSLQRLFLQAGIDTSEPVRINVHPYTGMPFISNHPDKARIQALLNGMPDILDQIRSVNAAASYSYKVSQSHHPASANLPGQVNKVQNALTQYTQNAQTNRIALEYNQDSGISIDVRDFSGQPVSTR